MPVTAPNSLGSDDIFPWNENFQTGLSTIDVQHQRLVELLNRLATHVALQSKHLHIESVFDELTDYTVYHFQTEESIWHQHLPDDHAETSHRAAHQAFIDTIGRMRQLHKEKPSEAVAEEILGFLARWLASHILESDRYLAHVVHGVQGGMPLDVAKLAAREKMNGATRILIDIILSIYETLSTNTLRLMREFSERKQAESSLAESEVLLSSIMDSTDDMIWAVDAQSFGLLTYNATLERHFLEAYGIVLHKGVLPEAMFETQESLDQWRGFYQRTVDSGRHSAEYTTRDGSLVMQLNFNPLVRDGKVFGVSVFGKDITERKAAEAVLASHQQHLEELVEERTRELSAAKEAAEVANVAKSTFLANMSHEIRTPMNAIVGLLHIMRREEATPKQLDRLGKIATAANHLLGVINDILDISKIEANKLTLEKTDFDLESVLTKVSEMVIDKVQQKHLELVIDTDPAIGVLHGDATRLGQALLNYLGNAVKFTERGMITLAARRLAESATDVELRFEVRDTGIGIPAEHLPRLFHAFEQADNTTTRRFGGTGLGLAITSRIAGLMGGQVGVESTPGVGSTFWMTAVFERTGIVPALEEGKALAGRRVLVVDDTPVTRLVHSQLLKQLGIESEAMASGRQALERIVAAERAGRPFDLVMIDFMMPDLDGFQTLQGILELPLARPPVAVLVTASGEEVIQEDAARLGFAETLLKPLSRSQLRQCLQRQFELRPQPVPATCPAPAVSPGQALILLVEDDPINREVAMIQLEDGGYRIEIAENGLAALEMVTRKSYDLILMDMQMPVMDGLEATRRIRALPGREAVPIVAMTANAFAEDRENCRAAGMNDFISKPIPPDQLLTTVGRWLAEKS